MITYLLIGILALMVVTLSSYFFSINIIYKRINKKNIRVLNIFPFEVVPQKRTDNFFINSLYLIYLIGLVSASIIFATKYFSVLTVIIAIATFFISLFIAVLPFVDFVSLKKHLYLDLGMVILFFLINGLITYLSFSISKLYDFQNVVGIVCMVIGALSLFPSLYFIFNLRLFSLNNEVNDDEISRPKYFPLAFSEWIIPLLLIIGTINLTLLSSILTV